MPACVAPTCHRTRPRKRVGRRTLPGRCVRPNPWHVFMTHVSGNGFSEAEVSLMYGKWKRRWLRNNPGLDRSAAKARMNADLCEQIAEANRLARSRTSASALARTRERRRKEAREKTRARVKAARLAESRGDRRRRARENAVARRATDIFFAKKDVPPDWKLNKHLKNLKGWFTFRHTLRSGKSEGIEMSRNTLDAMKPRKWFDDDVIAAYMALLGGNGNPSSRTCLFMTSHFYSTYAVTGRTFGNMPPDPNYFGKSAKVRYPLVRGWTRDLNTTGPVKIFVPVNHDNTHWTMVVIDVKNKNVLSLDSFGTDHVDTRNEMLDWVEQEHIAKKARFDRREWASRRKKVPTQTNSYDCGPFICMFAAFVSNDKNMTFLQGDMSNLRNRLVWSILNSTL